MYKNALYLKLVDLFAAIYNVLVAIKRDIEGIQFLTRLNSKMAMYERQSTTTADLFRQWVRKQPNKPCVCFYDQIWTFRDVNFHIASFFLNFWFLEITLKLNPGEELTHLFCIHFVFEFRHRWRFTATRLLIFF